MATTIGNSEEEETIAAAAEEETTAVVDEVVIAAEDVDTTVEDEEEAVVGTTMVDAEAITGEDVVVDTVVAAAVDTNGLEKDHNDLRLSPCVRFEIYPKNAFRDIKEPTNVKEPSYYTDYTFVNMNELYITATIITLSLPRFLEGRRDSTRCLHLFCL